MRPLWRHFPCRGAIHGARFDARAERDDAINGARVDARTGRDDAINNIPAADIGLNVGRTPRADAQCSLLLLMEFSPP
ncbi:hypothetical protein [Pantoea sp. Acro-807]|uniref:hypothetical protein n=1 Tax=Pantoea sp. Acro-807 TaxID=2608356 RepID=UPI00141A33C7|nr:hypothetical protein [Pantoea sp. Acro-807]NIE71924.1 hypothetical protein [Pantoea sp. Acro-807]